MYTLGKVVRVDTLSEVFTYEFIKYKKKKADGEETNIVIGRYRNNRTIGVYWNSGNKSFGVSSRHGRTSERFTEVAVVPKSFFLKSIFYNFRCHIDTRETYIVDGDLVDTLNSYFICYPVR